MTDNKPYPDLPKPVASSGYFPVYSSHQMRAYVDADRAMRAAEPPTSPVVEWIDKWGAKHRMSIGAATNALLQFYDEWPGGLEEIEAALKARPAVAQAAPASVDAHEIWAAAQLSPGEGIEDGVARVERLMAAPAAVAESLPERDANAPAEQQGLFRKFDVRRVDGSDQPGCKHHGCRYFVLDVDHDQHARAALSAYAAACEATHPALASDLRAKWGASPTTQKAAAVAGPSAPIMRLNGYQLRDALAFIAPDGTEEQLATEACIQRGPARADGEDADPAGLFCWYSDYPEEGSMRLGESPEDCFAAAPTQAAPQPVAPPHQIAKAATHAMSDFEVTESIIHKCPALRLPQSFVQHLGMTAQIVALKGATPEIAEFIAGACNKATEAATQPQEAAPMVDMVPPATRRDRWMYEQGRLAERDPRTPKAQEAAPHPDDGAVGALATLMKAKLAEKRAKGYGGWDTPECTQEHLSGLLREHVNKGDPVDVANFCAFLSARGEGIAKAAPSQDVEEAVKQCLSTGETFRALRRIVNLLLEARGTLGPEDHELRERIDALLKADAARAQQQEPRTPHPTIQTMIADMNGEIEG